MNENEPRIVTVRVISGETYIGQLVDQTPTHIQIDHPVLLEAHTQEDGSRNTIFYTWDDFSDDTVVAFDRFHVLYVGNPKKKVLDFYRKSLAQEGLYKETPPSEAEEVLRAMLDLASGEHQVN